MGELLVCLFLRFNFLVCKMRLIIFTFEIFEGANGVGYRRDLYYGTFSSEILFQGPFIFN